MVVPFGTNLMKTFRADTPQSLYQLRKYKRILEAQLDRLLGKVRETRLHSTHNYIATNRNIADLENRIAEIDFDIGERRKFVKIQESVREPNMPGLFDSPPNKTGESEEIITSDPNMENTETLGAAAHMPNPISSTITIPTPTNLITTANTNQSTTTKIDFSSLEFPKETPEQTTERLREEMKRMKNNYERELYNQNKLFNETFEKMSQDFDTYEQETFTNLKDKFEHFNTELNKPLQTNLPKHTGTIPKNQAFTTPKTSHVTNPIVHEKITPQIYAKGLTNQQSTHFSNTFSNFKPQSTSRTFINTSNNIPNPKTQSNKQQDNFPNFKHQQASQTFENVSNNIPNFNTQPNPQSNIQSIPNPTKEYLELNNQIHTIMRMLNSMNSQNTTDDHLQNQLNKIENEEREKTKSISQPLYRNQSQIRDSYSRRLRLVPIFNGESFKTLRDFLDIVEALDQSCINEAEQNELIETLNLQLRGEAREVVKNLYETNFNDMKRKLLDHFAYLKNKDIVTSQLENLHQEQKESINEYANRARNIFREKCNIYSYLSEDQKQEFNRIARRSFSKGIKDHKLKERLLTRGASSLEDAIAYAIETENDAIFSIPSSELFCKYCKTNGHRERDCRKKDNNNMNMNQLINALRNFKTIDSNTRTFSISQNREYTNRYNRPNSGYNRPNSGTWNNSRNFSERNPQNNQRNLNNNDNNRNENGQNSNFNRNSNNNNQRPWNNRSNSNPRNWSQNQRQRDDQNSQNNIRAFNAQLDSNTQQSPIESHQFSPNSEHFPRESEN